MTADMPLSKVAELLHTHLGARVLTQAEKDELDAFGLIMEWNAAIDAVDPKPPAEGPPRKKWDKPR